MAGCGMYESTLPHPPIDTELLATPPYGTTSSATSIVSEYCLQTSKSLKRFHANRKINLTSKMTGGENFNISLDAYISSFQGAWNEKVREKLRKKELHNWCYANLMECTSLWGTRWRSG
jgi:hypothetical protein